MLFLRPRRSLRIAAVATASAAAATALVALQPTVAHAATLPGTLAITSPANGKLAAGTAKQVVQLTVSGTGATTLSEATVSSVTLGGDAACATITNYVVTSPTTISVKTPSAGCAASSGGTAESVSINFNADADSITKPSAITFVAPPAILAKASQPVITDNSSDLGTAHQILRFVTTGSQVARVYAASGFAFDPRSSAGLSVSMSAKSGTNIKVYDPSGVLVPATTSTTPTVGNSLTFTTAGGMTAGDSSVVITQNGVSKTFTSTTDTGISVAPAPIVTSLSITSGRSGLATTVVVNGLNFDKTVADYASNVSVTFCGVAGTLGSTPVNTAGTQITVTTPTSSALGSSTYAGPCPVQVVDTVAGTSPITEKSVYTYLDELN